MRRVLRLWRTFARFHIRRFNAYRASFLMDFFAQGLNYAVDFLLMWIMVSAFDTMNGWNAFEVMLLYAVSLTAYGFGGSFFFFVRYTALPDIVSGAFDDVMLKPLNPLPFLVLKNINLGYITHLTLSTIMLVVCIKNLGISVNILTILYLIGVIACGALIFGAVFLFITAPAFLMTKADSLGSFMFFFRESSWYPISIYPRFMQIIMTVVLPFGMINFFPVQPLLQKQDYLMFGEYIVWVVPVFTAVFFAVAVRFFNFCVRRYKSTGS
jgi:ABC-2 type transport system permease protein